MSKKRAFEWAKTALLVILLASAMFLGWRTELLNDFFGDLPLFGSVAGLVQDSPVAETVGVIAKEAARPLTIVIIGEDGGRFAVRYDTDARNSAYERTRSILAEALGSASAPVEISENQWRAALSGPGVYYEYATPVRLSVLGGWLGTRMPDITEDSLLRRVYVEFGRERNRIYIQDYDSGLFYGADAATSAERAQELGTYVPNDAQFAFETAIQAADSAPYMVIMPGNIHPDVSADFSGSAEELLNIVLDALGHGDEMNTIGYDAGGALVSIGTQFRVIINPDGRVLYRRTDGLPPIGLGPAPDEGGLIELARIIVAETIGLGGDAEVFFESFEYDQDDNGVVTFGYYIAGGRVHLREDRHAARITFSEAMAIDVELNFRTFTQTADHTTMLPELQALAAARGEFKLSYSDTGPDRLQPFWEKT